MNISLFFSLIFTLFLAWKNPAIATDKNILIPAGITKQRELAIWQLKQYLKSLPVHMYRCGKHLLGGGSYNRLRAVGGNEAFQNAFRLQEYKRIPSTGNQFPFDNSEVAEVCSRDFGFCHGYTATLTVFNRLAHFDPQNISKQKFPDKKDPEAWFQFYSKLIDDVVFNRNPVIIPGYKNLYEFVDSDPRLTRYVKEHIALMWAKRNVSFTGYFNVLRSIYNKFSFKEAIALHSNLSEKINLRNYNPITWVAQPSFDKKGIFNVDEQAGIHVMQAYKITPIDENGEYIIYFWDIYTPHDANEATVEYHISTREKNKHGKPLMRAYRQHPHRNTKEQIGGNNYVFADIDQIPFDDIGVGNDAEKLIDFYEKNPEFTQYLIKEYEKYLKIPRKPYRVPYRGEEKIPPIKLADGRLWHWPKEMLYYDGDIWVEDYQYKKLPKQVKDVISLFYGEEWQGRYDKYGFQFPPPYAYPENEEILKFEWPSEWISYEGNIKIPNEELINLPVPMQMEIKRNLVFYPPQVDVDYFYLFSNQSASREVYEDKIFRKLLWKVPLEFIDDGKLIIPEGYEKHMPAEVKVLLKKNNLWPLKEPIPISIIDKTFREFRVKNHKKFEVPISWFDDDNYFSIPNEELSNLTNEQKEVLFGFKNKINEEDNWFDINLLSDGSWILRGDDGKSYPIPYRWRQYFIAYDTGEYLADSVVIPKDELENVPKYLRDIIVGVDGNWPPHIESMNYRRRKVQLKDGSNYYFPLSWVDNEGYLNLPAAAENIIPQKVIDEIFKVGPFKWPLEHPVSIYSLQPMPTYLSNGKPWFWPREWLRNEGMVKLPRSSKEIVEKIPKEILEKLKKKYPGALNNKLIFANINIEFEN
ncbi:MAG: hypothetical protein H6620_05735 [Halobacteriovoraceae bacterium]|nr:hypothetical protein [Halobacteriovoraceae bacterium]